MQFYSLMFHICALDMHFTQNSENKLTTTCSKMSPSSSGGVGEKCTWYMMNVNDTDVSIVNVEQQGGNNQTDDTSEIAQDELDSLLTSFTDKDTTKDAPTEIESSNVTTNIKSMYIKKPTKSKKRCA